MTWANLPEGCQKLYHNISGPNITVQSPSFPQLPEAINQSCKDPNKVCGQILKEKAEKGDFKDPLETYLRITVGDNLVCPRNMPSNHLTSADTQAGQLPRHSLCDGDLAPWPLFAYSSAW